MKAAYDSGINFFDCAEEYSGGESEIVMGEAIKKFGWKRNDLVISTKVRAKTPPMDIGKSHHPRLTNPPLRPPQLYWGQAFGDNPINNRGLSRKHVLEGMDASLKRLGLEYVDLIFAHRPDRKTPIEETVRAFNHLINTGKALYWGTSEWNADEIAQAWRYADKLGLIGPLMEQPAYNMQSRQKVEGEFAHLYRETGLGLTVFSPLNKGILTGKYKDGIPEGSRFSQSDLPFVSGFMKRAASTWDAVIQQVNDLEPIAKKLDISLATLALAWVLKNPNVSSAIIGASSPKQVYENIKALAAVEKLTPDIIEEIEKVLDNKPAEIVSRF